MLWALGFLVIIALLIPILAIVVDAPVTRRFLHGTEPAKTDELLKRMQVIEDEVADLARQLESLHEETQFVQRLLQHPEETDPSKQLAPPET